MKWKPELVRAPETKQREWKSNEEIRAVYMAHLEAHYAANTVRGYGRDIGVFFEVWGPTLVTTLAQADIEAFLARLAPKCSKLLNGANPVCRIGLDVSKCPLLTGADYASCKRYAPLDVMALWSYLRTIHSFYEWLLEAGHVPINPATGPMRRFRRKNLAVFEERRRKPRRRQMRIETLRTLIKKSPIQHAIMYLLMAKCFLRIHEVLKLTLAPSHCNLEEGWMDIPVIRGKPGKRQGNSRIILDAEAKRWLTRYLEWRSEHIKRDEAGQPITETLIITPFGKPWGKDAVSNIRAMMQRDCRRLGIMTGDETEREQRYGPHGLRAFATTWARDQRPAPVDAELQVIRGDRAPGAIDRYDFYMDRLPDLYQRFGPKLGV